jgi:DNA-directed RNA polymerase specialized sigma24 family protein
MLGPRACISERWTISTRLMPAAFPPQADAPPRGDEDLTARNEQLRSLLADAMRQLSFEHRAVIYRAYHQGWTTARIADDLQITDAAVKSQLHDALRTLLPIFDRDVRPKSIDFPTDGVEPPPPPRVCTSHEPRIIRGYA